MNWSREETRLVWWAIKKATRGFTFLPMRYEREDLFQEGALAWLRAREDWNSGRGQKSTFLYNVIEKHIRKLVDAGDTGKRKAELHAIQCIEGVTPDGFKYGEGNRRATVRPIEYDGDKGLNYNPVPRGAPMGRRLREEREPEIWEAQNGEMSEL